MYCTYTQSTGHGGEFEDFKKDLQELDRVMTSNGKKMTSHSIIERTSDKISIENSINTVIRVCE